MPARWNSSGSIEKGEAALKPQAAAHLGLESSEVSGYPRHGPGDGFLRFRELQRCVVLLLRAPDLAGPDGDFVVGRRADGVLEAARRTQAVDAFEHDGDDLVPLAGLGHH